MTAASAQAKYKCSLFALSPVDVESVKRQAQEVDDLVHYLFKTNNEHGLIQLVRNKKIHGFFDAAKYIPDALYTKDWHQAVKVIFEEYPYLVKSQIIVDFDKVELASYLDWVKAHNEKMVWLKEHPLDLSRAEELYKKYLGSGKVEDLSLIHI